MKKIIPILLVAAIAIAPLSAKKKTSTVDDTPDAYGENEVTAISVDKSKTKKNDADEDPYNENKMKPKADRSFGEKLFGLEKFQQIESFSLYTKSAFGKPKLKEATLIHRAGTDIGGFYCYYDTFTYAIQFAQKARGGLISAINQYFDDFENKRLDRSAKTRKIEAVYGEVEAYEEYGIATAMLNHYARPQVCFGYDFIDGSPYFSICVKRAKDLAYERNGIESAPQESSVQRYYFTKAQAKALATFLSDENIDALAASFNGNTNESDNSADEY